MRLYMAHKNRRDKLKRDRMNSRNPKNNKKGGKRPKVRGKVKSNLIFGVRIDPI